MLEIRNRSVDIRGTSQQLIILIHGYVGSSKQMRDVRDTTTIALPNADILTPDYPAGLLSNVNPIDITEALLDIIDQAVESRELRGGSYQEIIMIGHSLGALLLRKVYSFAMGQTDDSVIPLPAAPKPWVNKVSRIILLGGVNRGWDFSFKPKHLSWYKYLIINVLSKIAKFFQIASLIHSIQRGSPFVSNLRIQWIRLVHNNDSLLPLTIQLLGTLDDLISSDDDIDIKGTISFRYLRVPNTGHLSILDFSGELGKRRQQIFLKALTQNQENLHSDFVEPLRPDHEVEHVVFVMHGIRDRGFWTEEIRYQIKQMGMQEHRRIEVINSGYGYFPMLLFLFLWERQKNVRWFMDQYTEALARYPQAQMGFIGHSNGTYLLASALKRYQASQFGRVVFAGSVVPTTFPWNDLIASGRLKAIQNYVATSDTIVGVFPGFYELIGLTDLGSAGHNGFRDNEGRKNAVTFVRGGHSAAIRPEIYESFVRFVIDGKSADIPKPLIAKKRSSITVWLSKFNWVIWLLLASVWFFGAWLIIQVNPIYLWLYFGGLYALLYTT
jgi:pimeloyl-ACP methyl ester carboxylesterase